MRGERNSSLLLAPSSLKGSDQRVLVYRGIVFEHAFSGGGFGRALGDESVSLHQNGARVAGLDALHGLPIILHGAQPFAGF
jgi:hypothetical protein